MLVTYLLIYYLKRYRLIKLTLNDYIRPLIHQQEEALVAGSYVTAVRNNELCES